MSKRHGFTIVELLIVVVVIGILAGIVTVAYSGVQKSARGAAAKASLTQVADKLELYAVENGGVYPDTLAITDVRDAGNAVYQYSVNNSITPKTYCVTSTVQNISYYLNNTTQTVPSVGGCPGHGQDGIAAVTNYAVDPFFVATVPANYANTTNLTVVTEGSIRYAQGETTSPSAASIRLLINNDRWSISPGQAVFSRVTVRNANPGGSYAFSLSLRFYDVPASSSSGTVVSNVSGSIVAIPSGGTYDFSIDGIAPAGTQSVNVSVVRNTSSLHAVGDLIQATNVWLGSVDHEARSGDSPGWIWNGVLNHSTSTGPA